MATAGPESTVHGSKTNYDLPIPRKDRLVSEVAVGQKTSTDCRMRSGRHEHGLAGGNAEKSLPEAALAGAQCEGSLDNHRTHHQAQSAASEPRIGGYNTDLFLHKLDPKYCCTVCLLVLREAIQTSCGHRFCESCIENIRKSSVSSIALCPIDREPLTQVFPDIFCRREILSFRVRCSNNAEGCCWEGELIDLDKHLKSCNWEVTNCPNIGCEEQMLRKHLARHMQEKCLFRMVPCENCKESVLYTDLKIHVRDFCSDTPKLCPYNCGAVVPRKQLPSHLTDCMEAISACSFREMGCKFSGTRREVKAHENNPAFAAQHLNLACKVVSNKTNELVEMKVESQRKDALLVALSARVEQLESQANQQASTFERRFQQLEETLVTSTESSNSNEDLRTRILSLERVSTSNEMNMAAAQRQLTETCSDMQKISQQVSASAALADSHDLRLFGLETAGYSGVLIWKINFDKALADAKSGVKMSIYSPPFYSSHYGFKMCARLYPLGDGIGRSSHISYFFVIMSGENDAILPWPFRQRATLTLVDQSPARRDISETFLPDVSSSSFQRPTSGMNVASGCPRFVSHELLEARRNAYVKDGVIFLKVSVDKTGLDLP